MATGGQAAARPRVVVGGGFAGIGAARKRKKVDVVLVDKHDYRTLQPLLCQVPTDLLPSLSVGHTLRDLFHEQPNAHVRPARTARRRWSRGRWAGFSHERSERISVSLNE